MSVADLGQLVARLESVTTRLESVQLGGGGGGGAAADDTPLWHDDYTKEYQGHWEKFLKDTIALGGDVAKQGELLKKAFEAHSTLMKVASQFSAPAQADLQAVLQPLSAGISAVQDFREKNRASAQFNFLSSVSEAIPYLGWVAVAPKPAAYILQMEESAQFYTNKILKEFRQSDPKKADWSNSLIKLLKSFQQYVKDNHGTGLQWNKDKPKATGASAAQVGSGTTPSGGPPPPPPPAAGPPPPPPPSAGAPSKPAAAKPDTSALFSQINQGGDITKGLKKVTSDMQTHKNPALKATGTSASNISPRPFKKFTPPTSKAAAPVAKPAVMELQNKKWVVEYQDGNSNLVIEDAKSEQTVYMYKCTNSVLQIKGKINSVTLDNCKKCGVVFEDLISTCEFVNCQSVKAQANGTVPTLSIEKTDGAQIYLNEKSLATQIISAKSSEMNVCVQSPDGDLKETPLPEQFITVWDGKAFVTSNMSLNL